MSALNDRAKIIDWMNASRPAGTDAGSSTSQSSGARDARTPVDDTCDPVLPIDWEEEDDEEDDEDFLDDDEDLDLGDDDEEFLGDDDDDEDLEDEEIAGDEEE